MGAALEFQKHWIQTTFSHLGNDDHAMCFSKRIGWVESESVASDEEEIEENFDSGDSSDDDDDDDNDNDNFDS